MAKSILLVFANAAEGEDAEFNRWYDEQHLPDMLRIDHVEAAQRFRLDGVAVGAAEFPWRYFTLYELDTDDVPAVLAAIGERAGTAAMVGSPSLDRRSVNVVPARPAGPRTASLP